MQPDDRASAGAARARKWIHGCCAEDNHQSIAASAPKGIPKGIRPLGGVFPLLPPRAKGVAPQGEIIPLHGSGKMRKRPEYIDNPSVTAYAVPPPLHKGGLKGA